MEFGVSVDRAKNRGRLEIVRDVLSVATVRARKTRIMYQANLSFVQLEKYLGSLIEQGLVQCDHDSCYTVTWKGKEFLQLYNEYIERLRRIGEDINGVRKDRLHLESMCFSDNCDSKRINDRK